MNNYYMNLSFENNKLFSNVNIDTEEINEFSFHLAPNLIIDGIKVNDKFSPYKIEKTKLEFIGDVNKVSINIPSIKKIFIEYHGLINGWHNIISEEKILLSLYSCYYPQQCNINFDKVMVFVNKDQDYELVNGIFDSKLKKWVFDASDSEYSDYNIALFKNGYFFKKQVNNLTFYTTKFEELEMVNKATKLCEEVLNFYENLYGEEKNNPIAIVSNGFDKGGAYVRKKLIMLTSLKDNDFFLHSLFGHELGHLWASGANTNSFEDWLNETCAEWSCLSFMHHKNRLDLFDKELNIHLEYAKKYPTIITKDGSRPEGVHYAGVALFNIIYDKYGIEVINDLLKIFHSLQIKTTERYLEAIKTYSPKIYILLNEYLFK